MRVFSAEETAAALPYAPMLDALEAAYRAGLQAPLRHHHSLSKDGEPDATLLLMPGWAAEIGGVKLVNVTPGNGARGLPAVMASYLVFDAATGRHEAILDGAVLTARRTAAVGALGARLLARQDSRHLLVVGAGRVGEELPDAFRAALPIEEVTVWNPTAKRGEALVERLRNAGWSAHWQPDLATAVAVADVLSCATLAVEPVLQGVWLRPGQHVDLIGSFAPHMREADDACLSRAAVWVDCEGAFVESGDLAIPMETGALARNDVRGTLYDLAVQRPERAAEAITLFKAVGNAVSDLAAAATALGKPIS
ncbi:MAG: ornithine cyclodeaminase family protein [Pseudomonadota bacterium]